MARLVSLLVFVLLLLSPLLVVVVTGRPDGAVGCPANEAAPGPPHRDDGFAEGTLAEGGLNVTIDGQALVLNMPVDLLLGETYAVTIATETFFRGVLARIGPGDAVNATTDTLLTLVDDDPDLQISNDCLALGVSIVFLLAMERYKMFCSADNVRSRLFLGLARSVG